MFERVTRAVLFGAGMLCSVEAGHLFYVERLFSGGAYLLMTALFLFFAFRDGFFHRRMEENLPQRAEEWVRDVALLLAEEMVDSNKRIGRTAPPTGNEIDALEDRLMALLIKLNVSAAERQNLQDSLNVLRERSRQTEGRRAISRSMRL